MENLFIVTAVVGAVEFLRRLQIKDYFAALSIAVSAGIGALAGLWHLAGTADVATGIIIGLGASGLVTVASKINTSTTRPD